MIINMKICCCFNKQQFFLPLTGLTCWQSHVAKIYDELEIHIFKQTVSSTDMTVSVGYRYTWNNLNRVLSYPWWVFHRHFNLFLHICCHFHADDIWQVPGIQLGKKWRLPPSKLMLPGISHQNSFVHGK